MVLSYDCLGKYEHWFVFMLDVCSKWKHTMVGSWESDVCVSRTSYRTNRKLRSIPRRPGKKISSLTSTCNSHLRKNGDVVICLEYVWEGVGGNVWGYMREMFGRVLGPFMAIRGCFK